jgi:2,3-bisphosphoglycerate-independent phosphoglycerate mutase
MWTADHPKTSHTTWPVPCWYIKNWNVENINSEWWLYDIAPTILNIMWIDIPSEMTGKTLIK